MMNLKYLVTPERNLLIIHYSANKPQDSDPARRITMAHITEMNKAGLILMNRVRYSNYKEDQGELLKKGRHLYDLVTDFEKADDSVFLCGLKLSEPQRDFEILKILQQKHPNVIANDLPEYRKLTEWFKTIRDGPKIEHNYLAFLRKTFEELPHYIKLEFGLFPFL